MLKLKQWLGGLLVLQIVLAVGIYFASKKEVDPNAAQTLVAVADAATIDKVVIDGDKRTVTLLKRDGKWLMPDFSNLPANGQKVSELIDKIREAKTGWPVATSASSHERLQVAESNFERHVQFFQGETLLADLYLGTAPAYRSIHVRRSNEEVVYSVKLAKYDFFTENTEWFDRALLRVDEPVALSGADFSLKKSGENWELADANVQAADAALVLDQEKLKSIAELFSNIWIQNVVENFPDKDVISLKVSDKSGNREYHFAKAENDFLVKRSDINAVFSIRKKDFDTVAEWRLAHFVKAEEAAADAVEAEAAEGK